jgi:dihydrofolate reductase
MIQSNQHSTTISLIAAVASNGVIGNNGTLPWHLKNDFAWFVKQTTGHPIVMGRKNYEDIIRFSKGKPLKDRTNIVLTRQNLEAPGFVIYHDIDKIIADYAHHQDKLMIIGGTQIYEQFLPLADELILTEILQEFSGDSFFPQWNKADFTESFRQHNVEGDVAYDFVIYHRKSS